MELRDLEYFRVCAREKHLGRAAAALGLSQPALTKSIQRLERRLAVRLLERTRRGVEPTSVGLALLARIESIRFAVEQAEREAYDLAAGSAGLVRLGAGPTVAEPIMSPVWRELIRSLPKVRLQIMIGMNDVLLRAIEEGALDLALSTFPGRRAAGLSYEPVAEDELVVVSRRGHPLARRGRVSIVDLAGEGWALPGPGVLSRLALEELFGKAGLPLPRAVIESNSVPLLLSAIADSDLLGFEPLSALRAHGGKPALVRLSVAGCSLRRQVGLVSLSGAYMPPVVLRVADIIRRTAPRIYRGRPGK
jgi:DNA-binding transcriptional LysR family regulator